jgi:uncharacterized protein (DUF1778 family)
MDTTVKKTRIDLRVTVEQKAMLKHIAALKGMTLSKYVLNAAVTTAEEELKSFPQTTPDPKATP